MPPLAKWLRAAVLMLSAVSMLSTTVGPASASSIGGVRPIAPFSEDVLGTETLIRASQAPAGPKHPGVLAPHSHAFGASYGEWATRWWQWAYGLPVTGHPLFDETGAQAAAGQSGHVWFLGGVFNQTNTVSRTIRVPSGTALFFPILNVEVSELCPPGAPQFTVDQLRQQADLFMDTATDMACELDGQAIALHAGYRVTGDEFSVTMPSGNLYQFFGCNTPAGTYSPVVQDGYYLMLAPLPVGEHTLHFRGSMNLGQPFSLDITYHITVVAKGSFEVASSSAQEPLPAAVSASEKSRSSWGRLKAMYR